MALHIVQLGSPRRPDEGPRLGTVRRPPRGVPKSEFASRGYYDLWLPLLSPSAELVAAARAAADEADWQRFVRAFKREMAEPAPSQMLDLLGVMSHHATFSLGCYCDDESRCHRSVLRQLLLERGAALHAP